MVELHLFPAIRQGGIESGVAVVTVERALPAETPSDLPAETSSDVEDGDASVVGVTDEVPDAITDFVSDVVADVLPLTDVVTDARPSRYTVYSARYRLTLKGMDRGKWEVNVTEEADAPLITIEAVVRGVHRRSGDADETIRLSGADFRAALPEQVIAA